MMISWWSKHVGVFLNVLVCYILINVLLHTNALVGPLYIVNWNARWNSEIYWPYPSKNGPRQLSRYSDSLRAGRSGNRIPVVGEIFRTRPGQPWDPTNLLHNGYRGKAAEAWRWQPTLSSADVKKRVELYLYSPFRPSWHVLGWPLPLPSTKQMLSNFRSS
jgi:hypothetical protein